MVEEETKQAGTELGQAQLKLELGSTSTKIWGITSMIANFYQLLHITEQAGYLLSRVCGWMGGAGDNQNQG